MRSFAGILLGLCGVVGALHAQDASIRAWQMEAKGDGAGARALLARGAQSPSASPDALRAYAEFLDRHHDSSARQIYERLLNAAHGDQRMAAARRLVELDVLAEDRTAAARDLKEYRAAGGTDLTLPPPTPRNAAKEAVISIPGPIRSFARMAALAPNTDPDNLIPSLARNIVTNGYQATAGNEALEQTEYLKLVVRYLSQARELDKLGGADKVIRIETCDSTQTADLLRVLGYRIRGACGGDLVLETVNATRAFLTIDSGFPIAQLEQSLRTSRPFTYDVHPTEVPVLYGPDYWLPAKNKRTGDFIDYLIGDPALCRLYLGLSKLDPATAAALRKANSLQRLRAFAHVIDFYGGLFEIRGGKAAVPGGARSEKAWADLAGASPEKPAAFFERLIARDDGWLASYYDAIARITYDPANGPVQQYLTEPERLKRFYGAIRGKITSPGPARPVFRSNTEMLLLTARLRLDPDGQPHIPGGIAVWSQLFAGRTHGKYDSKIAKAAPGWKSADDVVEALFALTRKAVDNEPLQIFLALNDVDRHRATPLDAATATLLIRDYPEYGTQYSIFSEASELSNQSIAQFLDAAASIDHVRNLGVRADAAGTFQALLGLWQIFYRQGSIPAASADASFSQLLPLFSKVKTEREVFDSGRSGVKILLTATGPSKASPQDRLLDLLAGTGSANDSDAHTQLVEEMIRVFEAQRLISLETIFDLADNLESVARGQKADSKLISKAAGRIAEIQLPQASLSEAEKNQFAFGYWPERHIEQQRKLNLRALIDRASKDPKKLEDVRGLLAPFLRDTLVGLNYVHYAPPGAQILYTNPLFVRSHDFIGQQGSNYSTWKNTDAVGNGWSASSGGKLVGSLAGLPYALAAAEQNFLVPQKQQALIWGDLAPQMILMATVPRWWNVTPAQLHWVALHMRFTETQMADAALNSSRRNEFLEVLGRYAAPVSVSEVGKLLEAADVQAALGNVTPEQMFAIARDMLSSQEGIAVDGQPANGPIAAEIRQETSESPTQLNYAAISRAFGTPKPMLAHSYGPELLYLRTFPTLMGYSSRILAESWESNLLYYAAVADELQIPPARLNILVPQWTRETVEQIFATHLDDWPALLRSLRTVGDEAREKNHKQELVAGTGRP